MIHPLLTLRAAFALTLAATLHGQAQVVLFSDTFNRTNSTNLNASTTGKSGTLGALNWNEVIPTPNTTAGDAEIVSNRLALQSGNADALGVSKSAVPYVDHNFIGLELFTVSLAYGAAPNSGSVREVGFGIGNSLETLIGLTSSSPVGDVSVAFDAATSLDSTTGISIRENGVSVSYVSRALIAGDTLRTTFTSADMNDGTTLDYQVFINDDPNPIYTGATTWTGTNQNYIAIFNTHKQTTGDFTSVDNFAVLGGIVPPEPPSIRVLGVDFNRDDALAAPTQSLFRMIAGSTTQASNAPSYNRTIGPYQVTVSQPSGVNLEFRGANGDSSRAIPSGSLSQPFLICDFIATRTGAINLAINALPPGTYRFRSWHLDTITDSTLGFAQGATATTPNTIEARIGGVLKGSVQPTSLGSAGLNSLFISESQIPTLSFPITHDGSSPLTIELRSTVPNGSDNFLLLNGFDLYKIDP